MLNKELEHTLNNAYQQAKKMRHEFMTVEHLTLALLDNPSVINVVRACGVDLESLRKKLKDFIIDNTPVIPEDDANIETQPTLGFQRVLQRAVFQAQSAGKMEVNGANVLAAIFGEQESQSVFLLKQENLTRLDVINYISHGTSRGGDNRLSYNDLEQQMNEEGGDFSDNAPKSPLEQFSTNLNKRVKSGRMDPLIGRAEEIKRIVQVLCRRRKSNPLLVGDAGVGKTALAEGLAKEIIDKNVPPQLQDAVIYSLDLGALLAGTKYRGDFEKRLKGVLGQIKQQKHAIVFIDEIHTIIGAGAASGGMMDVSNLIKPLLASGGLTCMGSTTFHEYRTVFEKDHALARRFQKIDVKEPTVEETVEILKGLKSRFEKHHRLHYTDEALQIATELSARYITDRKLPDKAIDVVDEAGAYQALLDKDERKRVVDVGEVEAVIAKIARIPEKTVSTSDKESLRNLKRDLSMLVYGQEPAIDSLCSAVKLSRSGLRDTEKPVGSFLFAGPTGVGKTEVTKQLAKLLGIELMRFDMSEYMERHTVSRLIGSPPGYVGHEQGGLLTEAVNKNPYSIILLDEIEKAHPDIYNVLLQVMDHGKLTDSNGRECDFRHAMIIMTTNAGADVLSKTSIGFTTQDNSTDGMEAIKRQFSPEFRNRLDAIIQFKALSEDTIHHVVNKFVMELELQLEERDVHIEVDEKARDWLSENGYDAHMGARPMARLIQEKLKKPLAEELLFGSLNTGGTVKVSMKNNEIVFSIKASTKRPKKSLTNNTLSD